MTAEIARHGCLRTVVMCPKSSSWSPSIDPCGRLNDNAPKSGSIATNVSLFCEMSTRVPSSEQSHTTTV